MPVDFMGREFERACQNCRHFFVSVGSFGGACHGPGAEIFSPRLKEWTTDRGVFSRAAATVGLYRYGWRGRVVSPDHVCENHQTAREAADAGVPVHERVPTAPRRRQR